MLLTHKQDDVVTIKLVSGEEIIGQFVINTGDGITLKKPLVPVPTGKGSIGLAPYIMSSDYLVGGDPDILFNNSTIISVVKTSAQFRDSYLQQTGNVVIPKKSGLIL
jgi:hypothetical protein